MKKEIFEYDLIGKKLPQDYITLEHIGELLFWEIPTTSIHLDQNNNLFVREWADQDFTHNRFYFYKVDKEAVIKFINLEISHWDLIHLNNEVYFQDISFNGDNKSEIIVVLSNDIPKDYLPNKYHILDKYDFYDKENILNTLNKL